MGSKVSSDHSQNIKAYVAPFIICHLFHANIISVKKANDTADKNSASALKKLAAAAAAADTEEEGSGSDEDLIDLTKPVRRKIDISRRMPGVSHTLHLDRQYTDNRNPPSHGVHRGGGM